MGVRARADGALTRGLTLTGVHKRFGATTALEDARCVVRGGTVHALLGENGAGKTTLMRIAFGMVRPDAGEVRIGGAPITLRSSADAIAAGLGMVHQHFMLIPAMTVAENVALGGRGRFDRRRAEDRTRAIGREMGLALDPDALVRDLPVGAQQRLEVVKALARDARILVLDEPTGVLSPAEASELHTWLRRFAASGGTVVLITHRLEEALAVADDITVLRRGRTVLEAPTSALTSADVIAALTGEPAGTGEPLMHAVDVTSADPVHGAPVLALDGVSYVDARGVLRLDGVTLEVRAGEALGVIAVEGSGERELLRILAGRLEPTTGRARRPAAVGFVPGDRVHEALIPTLSLTENFALAQAGARRGLMQWGALRERTRQAITDYHVRAAGPGQAVAELSGGNQQRFVVARERAVAPQALVAENPARGLDIRAAAHVRAELVAARRAGAAIVLHSSDVEEVLAVTTRVVAMHAGHLREVPVPRDPSDREPYTRALLGMT